MSKLFLVLVLLVSAQQPTLAQDSVKIFSQEDLFWYLKNYHPVSKQAAIQIKKGENEVLQSRGQLDPLLFSNLDQKQFNQKEYYSLFSGGLKIPTWYGVDFATGYDQNKGLNVNPENELPNNGLVFAGVSVPVGQGLFIDKRRAAIMKANLFARSTFAEQKLMLNKLYFDATISYLDWVNYYNQIDLYQDALGLAEERFQGVKQSFVGGDIPAIDTLEAFILVQVRSVSLGQAMLDYQKATYDLSNYLWYERNTPLEITDHLIPPSIKSLSTYNTITLDSMLLILQNLKSNHPQFQWYDLKLKQLDVERRWNIEQLKPIFNLKYNFLNEPIGRNSLGGFSTNDYKWGFDFKIPLFLRESRGRLNITKLNIRETELEMDVKWLELSNKIRSFHNELVMLEAQIKLLKEATANYLKLLEAERRKFFMGESSIFLINSREAVYVQAAIKLIELQVKYQSVMAEFKMVSATW